MFTDYKSVLNQFCQKNKINAPKYFEAGGGFGGFSCEVIVKGETYMSHGIQKAKKDAHHNAAKWALLALDVPEGKRLLYFSLKETGDSGLFW